jgi:hypothetical protein
MRACFAALTLCRATTSDDANRLRLRELSLLVGGTGAEATNKKARASTENEAG